ncbi:hypothetical protein YC2023_058944 [Brassica napus]
MPVKFKFLRARACTRTSPLNLAIEILKWSEEITNICVMYTLCPVLIKFFSNQSYCLLAFYHLLQLVLPLVSFFVDPFFVATMLASCSPSSELESVRSLSSGGAIIDVVKWIHITDTDLLLICIKHSRLNREASYQKDFGKSESEVFYGQNPRFYSELSITITVWNKPPIAFKDSTRDMMNPHLHL